MRQFSPPAGALVALACAGMLVAGSATSAFGEQFTDEFQGAAGAPPNSAVWSFDTGGSWGNGQELEAYTDRRQNAELDGAGNLVITARKETFTGPDGVTRQYTSARLQTWKKFDFTYGHVAARIQVPGGKGLWPAFWALGDSAYSAEDWPASGELDVMELLGSHPSTTYGTLHGPIASSGDGYSIQGVYQSQTSLAKDFHTYSADWSPEAITFAVDGHNYKTVRSSELPRGASWPFNHPFFLLLNLAIGGSWAGSPDSTTAWPAHMNVDWVRVTPITPSKTTRRVTVRRVRGVLNGWVAKALSRTRPWL